VNDPRQPPSPPDATPPDATPPAVTDRLRWDDGLTRVKNDSSILRDPLRLTYAIGASIMFIGALLPWAEGLVGFLPKKFGGFEGAADGLILAGFSIIALLFARSRDFLRALDGARRWAPLLLGLGCVGIWLLGFQAAQMAIASWERDTGHGSMVIGYWVAGLGVGIVALVGAFASLRYHEGQTGDPTALIRRPRWSDAGPILTWIGGIAGLIAGASFALSTFSPITVAAPMVFLGGIGLIAGAYAGRAVGNAVGRRLGGARG
jgi:hypothetical protein